MPWHDLPQAGAPAPAVSAAAAGVKKAQHQLASLRNKRQAAEQRRLDLETEREAIALSVHGSGHHKENRKRLDEINLAVATHSSECASIDGAIRAAAQELANATAAEAIEEQRDRARQAVELAQAMRSPESAPPKLSRLFAVGLSGFGRSQPNCTR